MSNFAAGGFIESGGERRPLVEPGSPCYIIPKSVARKFAGPWLDRLNEKRDVDGD